MRTRTSTPAMKRWTHTDLSARMDTPTLSPAGVGSPPSPPLDTRLTDLLTELTRPVDPDQLNQEIEDFNISYPVDVDVPTVPKRAAMRTRTSTPAMKRWTHTDLSARMDTPTLSPAGVGSPPSPPLDTRLTDLLTELTRPVDPDQLNQEIEDFNISYPVDVDDALNLFSLPPVAGVGTAPATTITQPVTTSTQTRPVTSTRTRPVTATTTVPTTTSRPRPFTSARTRPVTTATTTVLASTTTVPARRRAGPGKFTTTSTVTTPSTRPRVAGKQPRPRPAVPSSPSPDSSPPPSNEDGDDEDDDRRRGLRRRLDLLNEDAQQRSRGRRI